MNQRLVRALLTYAALEAIAYFVLSGNLRLFIMLILAALAALTASSHFRPKD